jgi:two-component system nitrogen regulation sensor histidine kinase NtrY
MSNRLVRLREALQRSGRSWLFRTVLFLAVVLIISNVTEVLVLRYTTSHWPELVESRSAQNLETASTEFSSVQRSIRRSAVEVAMNEAVMAYCSGRDTGRVTLFHQLERYSREQGTGVEVYERSGNLVAWSGRSGPPQRREIRIALDGQLTSYVARTPVSSQLFVTTPVRARGQIVGAVLLRKTLEVSYPFTNRYLDREGLTERLTRDLGVDVRFDFSEGAEPLKDGRYKSTALNGIDRSRIGVVSVMHPTPSQYVDSISTRFHAFNTGVILVLILLLVVAAWRTDVAVSPVIRAGGLVLVLWVSRYTLLFLDIPSSLVAYGIFDPTAFASPFGGGIAKSIGEMSLSIVTLALSAGLTINVLLRPPAPNPPAQRRPILALVLVAGVALFTFGLFWALRGYGAVVRSAVFDSSIEYLDPRVLFPSLNVGLMTVNLIVLALCLVAVSTSCTVALLRSFTRYAGRGGLALGWLSFILAFGAAAFLFGAVQRTPLMTTIYRLAFGGGILGLSLFLVRSMRIGLPPVTRTSVLLALLLSAALLPPLLEDFVGENDRRRIELFAQESIQPADAWFSLVVQDGLRSMTGEDAVRVLEEGGQDALDQLAFTKWAQSPACREGYTSIFTLFDREGNRVSRFAIGGQLSQATTIDTSVIFDNVMEVSVRDIGAGANALKVYTGMTSIQNTGGSLLGFAQVTVAAGQQTLFRGETPIFLRGTSKASLQNFYRSVAVSEFRGGRLAPAGAEVFQAGYVLPDDILVSLNDPAKPWLWKNHAFDDQEFETLFISRLHGGEDVLALSLVRPGIGGDLVTLVKVFLHLGLLALVALGMFALPDVVRGQTSPRTFRGKLLIALVATAVVPVALLSLYSQYTTRERLLQESSRILDEETRSVASYFSGSLPGVADPSRIPPDPAQVEQIAGETDTDFNLYMGRDLTASSRPELVELGMLDSRISGDAYSALVLQGKRFHAETASVGRYRYAVGYRPLLDSTGAVGAVVGVPTLFRQDRVEEENTRRNAFLFGVYALVLLALLVIAAVLANRIAKPIQQLTEATRRVAAGELEVQVDAPGADGEVRELIESFDAMTRNLKQSRDELIRFERELAWKEMAKQVAHEIKNPLTPMRLSIQHLRHAYHDRVNDFDQLLDGVTKTVIEQIDALSRIASEFSHFARMPKAKMEECDVNRILEESTRLFSQEKGIRFEVALGKGLRPVLADREELRRAFINVLRNAIQAMEGKGTILVRSEPDGAGIRVNIQDQGKGIPEEMMGKLFQPNFSTKTDGMGLGLAIVKKTIDQLGGTIEISSVAGKGTNVTIILPGEGV